LNKHTIVLTIVF